MRMTTQETRNELPTGAPFPYDHPSHDSTVYTHVLEIRHIYNRHPSIPLGSLLMEEAHVALPNLLLIDVRFDSDSRGGNMRGGSRFE